MCTVSQERHVVDWLRLGRATLAMITMLAGNTELGQELLLRRLHDEPGGSFEACTANRTVASKVAYGWRRLQARCACNLRETGQRRDCLYTDGQILILVNEEPRPKHSGTCGRRRRAPCRAVN